MLTLNAIQAFTGALDDATTELVQRVRRSLVSVQNGDRGTGAGILWQRDGFVLTNFHVAGPAPERAWRRRQRLGSRPGGELRITLEDGREYPADLVAQDPDIDLALLRINAHDLPSALIADSRSLRVGQLVLAVGHPWGQRGVVTAGLVSGLSSVQTRRGGKIEIIRSDVGLAPGNSGGPLVNAAGGVVGINTMIVGGDLGVAIPSHIASAFVERALQQSNLSSQGRLL